MDLIYDFRPYDAVSMKRGDMVLRSHKIVYGLWICTEVDNLD